MYNIQFLYKKVRSIYIYTNYSIQIVCTVCTVTNTITTTLLSQAWVAGLAVPSTAAALPFELPL